METWSTFEEMKDREPLKIDVQQASNMWRWPQLKITFETVAKTDLLTESLNPQDVG